MDLLGMENVAFFHKEADPDNSEFGELIRCEFCHELAEVYSTSCPFCGRRFVYKNKTLYNPESEEN